MDIQAVLFDLDGTLVNSLQDIADSMNMALEKNGLPQHPLLSYRYFVGDGVNMLALRATEPNTEAASAVLKDYQANYAAGCRKETRPYNGILDLLKALEQKGLRICVFSNKPHRETLEVTAHFFPEISFAAVRGQKENVPVKPDPTGALEIAGELQIPPENFIYVGDTGVDMDCASAAHMIPVGALWGFRTAEELLRHHARHLITAPSDLMKLIG